MCISINVYVDKILGPGRCSCQRKQVQCGKGAKDEEQDNQNMSSSGRVRVVEAWVRAYEEILVPLLHRFVWCQQRSEPLLRLWH